MAASKFPFKFKLSISNILIGILIGAIIGVTCVFVLQNHNPKDERQVNPSVVFDRIVSKDELVCASQNYSITEKSVQDPQKFFDIFDIPFTDTSFWYRYVGTIKVGVDLSKAEFGQDGDSLVVTLDQPYIISNTPDMDASGILEENDNLFAHVSGEDIDNFQRECIRVSEENVTNGEMMEEARQNAQTNITDMFQAALGDDYKVSFVWRGADAKNAQDGE